MSALSVFVRLALWLCQTSSSSSQHRRYAAKVLSPSFIFAVLDASLCR